MVEESDAWKVGDSDVLAFDKQSGGKPLTPSESTEELNKYGIRSNTCQKVKDYQHYNIQFALEIINTYKENTKDAFNGNFRVISNLKEVLDKVYEYFDACKIEFKEKYKGGKMDGWGYWDNERIVINSSIDTSPFAIASVLMHEGYHAQVERSHGESFNDEILIKFTELKFYNDVMESVNFYLQGRYYASKSGKVHRIKKEKIFGIYRWEMFKVNALNERNILVDRVISKYSDKLDLSWIKLNWNLYGGINSREQRTVTTYLNYFAKSKYLEDDEYVALIEMLFVLKDKDVMKVFSYDQLRLKVRQKIINQANKNGEKERAILEWLEAK